MFYPLDKNKYYSQDSFGDVLTMPAAVEVTVCGVRLVFPTSYVLVTDFDGGKNGGLADNANASSTKSMHTCSNRDETPLMGLDCFHAEPTPFTTSNHAFLAAGGGGGAPAAAAPSAFASTVGEHHSATGGIRQSEMVWQEETTVNPEWSSDQLTARLSNLGLGESAVAGGPPVKLESALAHWDMGNPARVMPKQKRKDRKNYRSKSYYKTPFHRKSSAMEGMGWAAQPPPGVVGTLEAASSLSGNNTQGNATAGLLNPISNPGSVRGSGGGAGAPIPSPASVGTPALTPRPTPQARTPAGPDSLMSPMNPPTPMDSVGLLDPKTPKSVGGPPTPYSPMMKAVKTETAAAIKVEPKAEPLDHNPYGTLPAPKHQQQVMEHACGPPFKRPALPFKEYEAELSKEGKALSDSVYDAESMTHWLNHPVKKFRSHPGSATGAQKGDKPSPKRPFYRRKSQTDFYKQQQQASCLAAVKTAGADTDNRMDVETNGVSAAVSDDEDRSDIKVGVMFHKQSVVS